MLCLQECVVNGVIPESLEIQICLLEFISFWGGGCSGASSDHKTTILHIFNLPKQGTSSAGLPAYPHSALEGFEI